jgi:hypothetical protein
MELTRKLNNAESLSYVSTAVAAVESATQKLARLEADLAASSERIAKAQNDGEQIRVNDDGADRTKRSNRLRDLQALEALERSDAERLVKRN